MFFRFDTVKYIIRLGEYDSETNPDCDGSMCNEPYLDIGIKSINRHERYTGGHDNDICIFTLARPVRFTGKKIVKIGNKRC